MCTSIAAAFVVIGAAEAAAHGPCLCLSPPTGAPGTTISVPDSYGAVEVLWNPNPRRLKNPALVGSRWARLFRSNVPTLSLARQHDPGEIEFEVPRVPDGKYLVVIFDVTEGEHNHYTWNSFTVDRSPLPATGAPWGGLLLAALGAVAAGASSQAIAARVVG